jgi:tetratricopeptide (TPR) repeat protein
MLKTVSDKPTLRYALTMVALLAAMAAPAFGQRGPAREKDQRSPAEAEVETNAKHDLDIARWYVEKRKAYAGARDRLQEIVTTYPEFSRVHEAIYLLGFVDQKLGKNAEAINAYRKLLKEFPGSEYDKKAREELAKMNAPPEAPPGKAPDPKTPANPDSDKGKGEGDDKKPPDGGLF